jgi:hypothetical protein
MSTLQEEKLRAVYTLFMAKRGEAGKLSHIIDVTDWRLSTFRDLVKKNWSGEVLEKSSQAAYTIVMPETMTFEQFGELTPMLQP